MNSRIACIALAVVVLAGCARRPAENKELVEARFTAAALPFEDPRSKLWDQAPEHPAPLLPQEMAEPILTEPGADLVRVRALHNGEWVVFRLEWNDSTEDLIPHTGRSSDAVAIQFPLRGDGDVPDAAMGETGKGVRIWFWKAVWQDDTARAASQSGDRVATLYPNAAVDHYPYEANPKARAEMEKRYAPARAAGNPITVRPNGTPVQVLAAEGFGNTHVAPLQPGRGKGQWAGGKWLVTIARPLAGTAELGDLTAGRRAFVAFAVWDGAKAHTGSRKMRSEWIPLVLESK